MSLSRLMGIELVTPFFVIVNCPAHRSAQSLFSLPSMESENDELD